MDVRPLKQRKNTCGPTSLRMVLGFYGLEVTEKEILKEIGGLKNHGVRAIDLARFAKKKGFETETLSYSKTLAKKQATIKKPNISDIFGFLKKGIPVILAVRSSLLYDQKMNWWGHFVVVTDYKKGVFRYIDPFDGEYCDIKKDDLLFAWYNNAIGSSAYFLAVWPKGFKKEKIKIILQTSSVPLGIAEEVSLSV